MTLRVLGFSAATDLSVTIDYFNLVLVCVPLVWVFVSEHAMFLTLDVAPPKKTNALMTTYAYSRVSAYPSPILSGFVVGGVRGDECRGNYNSVGVN